MYLISSVSSLVFLQITTLFLIQADQTSLFVKNFYSFANIQRKKGFKLPLESPPEFQAYFHMNHHEKNRKGQLCNDEYQSSFWIEKIDKDGSNSCIHLTTNDKVNELNGYQLVDNGVVMIYNIPHPDNFPSHCPNANQITFKIHYNCNPGQDKIRNVAIFDGQQLSCSPQLYFDSKQICQYITKSNQGTQQRNSGCHGIRKSVYEDLEGWLIQIESLYGQCQFANLKHLNQKLNDSYKSMISLLITPPNLKQLYIHLIDNNQENLWEISSLAQGKGFKNTIKVQKTSPFPQRCNNNIYFTIFYICNPEQLIKYNEGSFFKGKELKCNPFWKIQSKYFCLKQSLDLIILRYQFPAYIIKKIQKFQGQYQYSQFTTSFKDQFKEKISKFMEYVEHSEVDRETDAHLNKLLEFLQNRKYIFIAILIPIGIFLIICGLKLYKISSILASMASFGVIITIFGFYFFNYYCEEKWAIFIIIAAGVIICVALGCLINKFPRVGIFLIGGWSGGCLFILIFTILNHYYELDLTSFLVIFLVLFIIAGIFSLQYQDHALADGTSIIGSKFCVVGSSLFLSHGTATMDMLINMLNKGQIPVWTYILLSFGWIIISIIAILYQERVLKKQKPQVKKKRHQQLKINVEINEEEPNPQE